MFTLRSLLLVAFMATTAMAFSKASFYDLSATRSDGTIQSMEDCKGKVVYATNVASRLTRREYNQMKQLGERWGDDLMILAFPSMEFGGQEFSDDAEIQAFADKQDFPGVLMKLGNVLGSDAPKVWQYLKSETGAEDPDWNFQGKFLVDKEGKVSVPGDDLDSDIEALM